MTPLPRLRTKRLTDTAVLPHRGTPHSSGLDIYADLGGNGGSLELGVVPTLVSTGLAMEIPPGYEVQIRPRSGLSRRGVDVAFGTVDADYRGELKVNMAMRAGQPEAVSINHGDRQRLAIPDIINADTSSPPITSPYCIPDKTSSP